MLHFLRFGKEIKDNSCCYTDQASLIILEKLIEINLFCYTYVMKIGIFGSSHSNDIETTKQAGEMGIIIANKNHEVVTGGGPGYCHTVAMSTIHAGGKSTIYAVGLNKEDHSVYHDTDLSNYTTTVFQKTYFKEKLSNIDNYWRSLEMISDIDTAIIIGCRVGTMYEVTILSGMGKDFFVLENSGGITGETIKNFIEEGHKEKSKITFIENAQELQNYLP